MRRYSRFSAEHVTIVGSPRAMAPAMTACTVSDTAPTIRVWHVRSICDWLNPGRPEWQAFHDDSVFEAVILSHPNGRALLRYLYRGELYDERITQVALPRAEMQQEYTSS
jgi:hypothetical protein